MLAMSQNCATSIILQFLSLMQFPLYYHVLVILCNKTNVHIHAVDCATIFHLRPANKLADCSASGTDKRAR